jgi:type I restriction-modification system DNA methylase subunit
MTAKRTRLTTEITAHGQLPQTFDESFERVKQLVTVFHHSEEQYLSSKHSEAQARKDFIDKFWIALGWDVNHEHQTNPYEQEVKVERNVAVQGRNKKADYAFLGSNFRDVRFFVEAKKPSGVLSDASDYFQTIRYGWNAQTPLSILTDFVQFRVLDCRYKPNILTAVDRSIPELTFHYLEYAHPDKFKQIYYLFSRESVLNGSLEKYAANMPKPTGKAIQRGLFGGAYKSVDENFLIELDEIREELARGFKNRNLKLNGEDLTEATQRTIDRLVFMRFLEDKLIEPEVMVEKLGEHGSAWGDFVSQSKRLNTIYNGIIFKPHWLIDDAAFVVDEKVFVEVRERLAHTNSVYDFDSLPVHILGSIYERFLGKVITTTAKRAKVEDKPEVRKAGGVYYTPEYIVRYIVANTVGKYIEGKTPAEIREMRFADLACGSGSFLLGVYDTLLRYHTAYYNRSKRTRAEGLKAKCLYKEGGMLQLSLLQKRQILLTNIYGVDIDPQAVEVAQLSLYLKLLEDETIASTHKQQLEMKQALLPSLGKNIICGNSLIAWDILDGKLFESGEERSVNPMNFEDKFPEVMKRGGFDVIVGNPPYLSIDDTWGKGDLRQRYIKKSYSFVHNDKTDILFYFLAKAVQLSRRVGFIVSRAFLEAYKANKLRAWLAQNANVTEIVDLRNYYVFKGVGITTAIVLLDKDREVPNARIYQLTSDTFLESELARDLKDKTLFQAFTVSNESLGAAPWTFASDAIEIVKGKIDAAGKPLAKVLTIGQGMQTGRNEVFGKIDRTRVEEWGLAKGQYFVRARNSDIRRYEIQDRGEMLLYVENFRSFEELPEGVRTHLLAHRAELEERAAYQRGDCEWWKYTWPLHKEHAHEPKLICPYLAKENRFAFDAEQKFLGLTDTTVLYDASQPESMYYLMALLNSRLLTFRFRFIGKLKSGGILEYFWNSISKLPIRRIDFSNADDEARHDQVVHLVKELLDCKERLAASRSERDRGFYDGKCNALDHKIDELVYDLYGLTDKEIAIIQDSFV